MVNIIPFDNITWALPKPSTRVDGPEMVVNEVTLGSQDSIQVRRGKNRKKRAWQTNRERGEDRISKPDRERRSRVDAEKRVLGRSQTTFDIDSTRVKTSAVCGPHLQPSAAEKVDQMSAVCKKKTHCGCSYCPLSRRVSDSRKRWVDAASDQPATSDQHAAVLNQARGEAPTRSEESRSDAPAEAEVEEGGCFAIEKKEEKGFGIQPKP
ncbi:hypothetical protein LXL04_006787 [Taraxacum kok-saghyz]